jgi:hypothetical protein
VAVPVEELLVDVDRHADVGHAAALVSDRQGELEVSAHTWSEGAVNPGLAARIEDDAVALQGLEKHGASRRRCHAPPDRGRRRHCAGKALEEAESSRSQPVSRHPARQASGAAATSRSVVLPASASTDLVRESAHVLDQLRVAAVQRRSFGPHPRQPSDDHRRGRSSQAREQVAVLLEVTVAEELGCRARASATAQSRRLLRVTQQPLDRGTEGGEVVRVFDQQPVLAV